MLSQTLNKDTNLDSIAKNNNISTGKAALVSQACALNKSLDLTQLAALSVDELNDLLEVGAPGMPIGKNAAADIALADSGLNSAGAHIEVDSDIDDIPAHYDVEVEYAGVEYEYKIDAYTGAIIEKKTDTLLNDSFSLFVIFLLSFRNCSLNASLRISLQNSP